MATLTIRIGKDLHEKLRWLSFKERRSQNAIVAEALEKAFQSVKPPKGK